MTKYKMTYLRLMKQMRPKEYADKDGQPAMPYPNLPADKQFKGSRLKQLADEAEKAYSKQERKAGSDAARWDRTLGKTKEEQAQARWLAVSQRGSDNMDLLASTIEWEPEALEQRVASGLMEDADLDPAFDEEGNPANLSPTIYWKRRERWEAQLKVAAAAHGVDSWQADEIQQKLDNLEPSFPV